MGIRKSILENISLREPSGIDPNIRCIHCSKKIGRRTMLLIKCEENGSMGKKLVNFTKKLMNFGNFLVHSSKIYSTNNFAKTNKIVTLQTCLQVFPQWLTGQPSAGAYSFLLSGTILTGCQYSSGETTLGSLIQATAVCRDEFAVTI